MFGTRFVQDRIRVVEVDEQLAPSDSFSINIFQQAQTLLYRNVSHLVRGLTAALNALQFVVAPKGAVEQEHVDLTDLFEQRVAETAYGGNVPTRFPEEDSKNNAAVA